MNISIRIDANPVQAAQQPPAPQHCPHRVPYRRALPRLTAEDRQVLRRVLHRAIVSEVAASARNPAPAAHHETSPATPEIRPPEKKDRLALLLSGQGVELSEAETELLRVKWGGLLTLCSPDVPLETPE